MMDKKYDWLSRSLGPQDIPELLSAVRDSDLDYGVRKDAIIALGKIGDPAVEALTQLIQHAFPGIRQAAIEALGNIESPSSAMLRALEERLQDEDREVRKALAIQLGKMGSGTLRLLEKALDDKFDDVCAHAVMALAKQLPVSMTVLQDALEHKNELVRKMTAQVLNQPEPRSVKPPGRKSGAFRTFEQMRQEAHRSIPDRRKKPGNPDAQ